MKSAVTPRRPEELAMTHPLTNLVDGWYFRLKEISAGVFEVEGVDAVGRRVRRSGTDEKNFCDSLWTMPSRSSAMWAVSPNSSLESRRSTSAAQLSR